MSQWLPLADGCLSAVCDFLPSPDRLSDERISALLFPSEETALMELEVADEVKMLKNHFAACSSDETAPVVVYISKMFAAEKSQLPENRRRPLSAEQIQAIRARQQQQRNDGERKVQFDEAVKTATFTQMDESQHNAASENGNSEDTDCVFMAFARIFSGLLRPGQRLYVASSGPAETKIQVDIGRLYLMMGRELEAIDCAYSGDVLAIGGLDDVVFKTATLSNVDYCPPLAQLLFYAYPIVRVSVEPKHPADMPKLVRALKLLNQTDPGVKTYVQDTGEHVLVTAGEVHLQRCLSDLRERFSTSKIDLNVSEPIIPFHECIASNHLTFDRSVEIKTSNRKVTLKIRAVALPQNVLDVLDRRENLLKNAKFSDVADRNTFVLAEENLKILRKELAGALDENEKENHFWKGASEKIWSFGPTKARCNLLFNNVKEYHRPSFWKKPLSSELRDYDQSVVSGFQLRCQCGPLCDEPLRGVAFIVDEWTENSSEENYEKTEAYGPVSGQIIAAVKEGCKLAFQAQPQRLSMAMYSCLIQATGEVLGRVYGVLSKRGGRVLKEDVKEGTNLFQIEAALPVVESFGFADEIRTRTSGLASPQLVFSHWEILDIDPHWIPNTEEELELYGDKADTENRALKYMNAVRRRKGLPIDEKTIEHAEKQRTLARKV